MSLIEIDNLQVTRNGTTICRVPRLAIECGERLAVLGDNGSGKTTLLRVLAGLERRYAGHCAIEVAPRQRIYVDQSPFTFRGTVLFNAMYGLRAHGMPRRAARSGALRWLERFGLASLAAADVRRLSGGELRRLALARAAAVKPRLLLLDEPLADLDGQGAACVRRALAELADTTILVSSPTTLPDSLCAREFRLATSRSAPNTA